MSWRRKHDDQGNQQNQWIGVNLGNPGDYQGLDPELAELMRLEELERQQMATTSPLAPGQVDQEMAELLRLEEEERQGTATWMPPGIDDPELRELIRLEELERRRGNQGP